MGRTIRRNLNSLICEVIEWPSARSSSKAIRVIFSQNCMQHYIRESIILEVATSGLDGLFYEKSPTAMNHFTSSTHQPVTNKNNTVQAFNSLPRSTRRLPVPGCTTPMDSISKDKTSTSMTNVAGESKLRSVVRSPMHPCPVNSVAIVYEVVYWLLGVPTHLVQ